MAKKALCIGINNYPGTHMDLQGCVNDANDWAATLSERGFAVTQLLDAQATKAAMIAGMSELIGKAAKDDSLVITFSGHGTYQPDTDGDEADGLDEALCPYDLQTLGQALTDDEIKALFAARKADRLVPARGEESLTGVPFGRGNDVRPGPIGLLQLAHSIFITPLRNT